MPKKSAPRKKRKSSSKAARPQPDKPASASPAAAEVKAPVPPPTPPAVKPTAKPVTDPDDDDARDLKAALRPELELYYDIRDGSYVSKLNGRFVTMGKADLQLRFKALGLRNDLYLKTKHAGSLPQTDYPLFAAQNERMIDFSGPVAGRRIGVYQDGGGRKYLVTDEATGVWKDLIPAAKPVFFKEFLNELLPGDQAEAWCFWMTESLRAMRAVDFSPGQACFFVGEGGCGKSFLQHCVTELLGGRFANPFEYLMGEKFNKDLIGAEHWMIEDPKNSTDIRTRRDFGERIKEATVVRDIRVRAMCKDATMLQLFRRLTASVNNEKESVATVPPMVAGVKDKINLFACAKVIKAFEPFKNGNGQVDREKLWSVFRAEAHAVRSWLLQTFSKIPTAFRDDRFGVAAYHEPEILKELAGMTYECRFLELVDEKFFSNEGDIPVPIEKPASGWQSALLEFNKFEAEKIFRYVGQCGSHLGKLWREDGQIETNSERANGPARYRVSRRILDGNALWTIKPPFKSTEK